MGEEGAVLSDSTPDLEVGVQEGRCGGLKFGVWWVVVWG